VTISAGNPQQAGRDCEDMTATTATSTYANLTKKSAYPKKIFTGHQFSENAPLNFFDKKPS
jgi:hypothetical protein